MTLLCDVSKWQGAIDFHKMARKAEGVIIKLSEGTGADPRAAINWEQSRGVLPRGGYCYFHPEIDGVLEARAMVALCNGDYGEMPLSVDVESPAQAWLAENFFNLDQEKRETAEYVTAQLTLWVSGWIESLRACLAEIERLVGRRPMIYTGAWFIPFLGDQPWLAGYPLWLAAYTADGQIGTPPKAPAPWKSYTIWQYGSSGGGAEYGVNSVDIDKDLYVGSDFAAFCGKGTPVTNTDVNEYDVYNSDEQRSYHGVMTFQGIILPKGSPPPPPKTSTWKVEWYAGAVPGTGNVLLTVNKADINYDVQNLAPEPGLPVDNICARATRSIWFPAGYYKVTLTVDDGGRVMFDGGADLFKGAAWKVQAATTYEAVVNFPSDAQHNVVGEFYEVGGWLRWGLTIVPTDKPPPPPPPSNKFVNRAIGFHMMGSGPKPDGSENDLHMLFINNNDDAIRLVQRGLYGALRYWPADANPVAHAKAMPRTIAGVADVATNEGDSDLSRKSGESYDAYFQRRINYEQAFIRTRMADYGDTDFYVETWSMGTPDWTDPACVAAYAKWYVPFIAGQQVDGKPCHIYTDTHSYSPSMTHIYSALGDRAERFGETFIYYPELYTQYERFEIPMVGHRLDGSTFTYMTTILQPPKTNMPYAEWRPRGYSQLHGDVAALTVTPDRWYETRWWWPYQLCNKDPRIQCEVASETGMDEGGVGGFWAHHATLQDVINWIVHFLDISCAPLVIESGTFKGTWPSPWKVGYIFQYSGDPAWAGYSMIQYMSGLPHNILVRPA